MGCAFCWTSALNSRKLRHFAFVWASLQALGPAILKITGSGYCQCFGLKLCQSLTWTKANFVFFFQNICTINQFLYNTCFVATIHRSFSNRCKYLSIETLWFCFYLYQDLASTQNEQAEPHLLSPKLIVYNLVYIVGMWLLFWKAASQLTLTSK